MQHASIRFVDSHCHLDIIHQLHPGALAWLDEVGCLPVSWAFGFGIETRADLARALKTQRETIQAIAEQGHPCRFLAGVHPRNIPPDLRAEDIAALLSASLAHPLCRGVGEIGLETAGTHEKEILGAQLELAAEVRQRGQVFGLHTPRHDKPRVTTEILRLLEPWQDLHDIIVIDHATPATIPAILARGYRAGITLAPEKTTAAELEQIVADHPDHLDRIMLNTDSGSHFHDDLHRYTLTAPPGTARRLARDNALGFYGLQP